MVHTFLFSLIPVLDLFARGGGGGSGGGGGGGGSGSGGGGIIFLIGYAVGHGAAWVCKKFFSRTTALVVSSIICAIASLFCLIIGIFSQNGTVLIICLGIIAGIWVGWAGVMFGVWERLGKRFKKADEDLAKAGWNEEALKQHVTNIFMRYQDEWSRRDATRFNEYMTPDYANHATLMIRTLSEMHRIDEMSDIHILRMDTSSVTDNPNDDDDSFTMVIEATAKDRLYDEVTGKDLFVDNSSFMEEWSFRRHADTWLLAGIRQFTQDLSTVQTDLQQFATDNNMYYSIDMGWLFLPARGELFNQGKWSFGFSDINNHVVGTYHDHLVQLYTYTRYQDTAKTSFATFLVGQINLPKSYGGIVVESSSSAIKKHIFPPSGYQQYTFEWPDFNKRYTVYATDADRLAAFELINPGFMAYLYDHFTDVNLEVVDNVVYFYAQKIGVRTDYNQLMQLLLRSFKELQL